MDEQIPKKRKNDMLLNRKTMAVVLMAVTACLSLAAAADDNDAFRQSAEYMKVETFQANQNPVTDEPSGSGMLTTSGYRGYRLEVNETAF